jgi:hypothetical protein
MPRFSIIYNNLIISNDLKMSEKHGTTDLELASGVGRYAERIAALETNDYGAPHTLNGLSENGCWCPSVHVCRKGVRAGKSRRTLCKPKNRKSLSILQ